jgi:hypothetical protein
MKLPGSYTERAKRAWRRECIKKKDLIGLKKPKNKKSKLTHLPTPPHPSPFFISGSVSILAGDDALTASLYTLASVITGSIRLAFRHSLILFYALRACPELEYMCPRLLELCKEDLYEFFKIRIAVNKKREELGSDPLETTNEIETMVLKFIEERGLFSSEFTPDQVIDINGVTNEWCISKQVPMKTVDTVTIVFDDSGIPWIKLIQRECSPGKGLYALAGGIVEDGETMEQTAEREDNEEAKIMVSGLTFIKSSVSMKTMEKALTFDIRFKYGLGSHGLTVVIYGKKKYSLIPTNDYKIDLNIYGL